MPLDRFADEIRSCRKCATKLSEYGVVPRPIFGGGVGYPVILIGQAPGKTEYERNAPFQGGRSSQSGDGHDMDHYADDLAALTAHLNLKNAIHIGYSTGGGEVARYIARHGESRVAKAVLISAVPPLMIKTPENPGGLPKAVFDGFQAQVAANWAQFYLDLPTGPFYGYNRPGAKVSQGVIQNWWR